MKEFVRICFTVMAILSLLLLMNSCGGDGMHHVPEDQGYDYYPLEVGRQWTYKSDSVLYNKQTASVDTFSSFIREELIDTFRDGAGDKVFIVERLFRKTEIDEWKVIDIWTASSDSHEAIRTEENLRQLKMVFPAKVGVSWDHNVFYDENIEVIVGGESLTPYKYWNPTITEKLDNYIISGNTFSDVIIVDQVRDSSIIELRFAEELYAKNVGLIERRMSILETQCIECAGQPWTKKAEKGFILHWRLIEYK